MRNNLLSYQLVSVFRPAYFIFIVTGVFIQVLNMYLSMREKGFEVEDSFVQTILMLYTPIKIPEDLFVMPMFLLPFFVIIGLFFQRETEDYQIYSLIHMRSYSAWLHASTGAVLIFYAAALLLSFFLVWLFSNIFPLRGGIALASEFPVLAGMGAITLVHNYFLMLISLYMLFLVFLLLFFITRYISLASLLMLSVVMVCLVNSYINPKSYSYLPPVYGFFRFREFNDFPLLFAYSGGIGTCIVLYLCVIGVFRWNREQIFSDKK